MGTGRGRVARPRRPDGPHEQAARAVPYDALLLAVGAGWPRPSSTSRSSTTRTPTRPTTASSRTSRVATRAASPWCSRGTGLAAAGLRARADDRRARREHGRGGPRRERRHARAGAVGRTRRGRQPRPSSSCSSVGEYASTPNARPAGARRPARARRARWARARGGADRRAAAHRGPPAPQRAVGRRRLRAASTSFAGCRTWPSTSSPPATPPNLPLKHGGLGAQQADVAAAGIAALAGADVDARAAAAGRPRRSPHRRGAALPHRPDRGWPGGVRGDDRAGLAGRREGGRRGARPVPALAGAALGLTFSTTVVVNVSSPAPARPPRDTTQLGAQDDDGQGRGDGQ